jgi:hypothetical protein
VVGSTGLYRQSATAEGKGPDFLALFLLIKILDNFISCSAITTRCCILLKNMNVVVIIVEFCVELFHGFLSNEVLLCAAGFSC